MTIAISISKINYAERIAWSLTVVHFPAFRFNLSLRGTKQSHQTFLSRNDRISSSIRAKQYLSYQENIISKPIPFKLLNYKLLNLFLKTYLYNMILVTGGTGLVGAHLLLHLAENENNIRAIYRNEQKTEKTKKLFSVYNKEHLFAKIQWIKADILDVPSLEIAFKNIEYVYHCAAQISFNPKDENLLRKVNIEGTANIVNFCIDKNIKKLCHVSSIAALGDLKENETILSEEIEWNPEAFHSDYAITKYGAEMEVWRGQQEGLNVVIVNPGVIFGTTLWKDGSGEFFTKIKKGFPFYTKGSTGYIGVFDVVKVMHLLMKSTVSGERFSLITENLSFEEIIFKIADKLNVKKPTFEVKPWMTSIAWRLDWLVSTVFRSKRNITKYGANSLHSKEIISNEKIKNPEISGLNYEFQSIDSVLDEIILLDKKINTL